MSEKRRGRREGEIGHSEANEGISMKAGDSMAATNVVSWGGGATSIQPHVARSICLCLPSVAWVLSSAVPPTAPRSFFWIFLLHSPRCPFRVHPRTPTSPTRLAPLALCNSFPHYDHHHHHASTIAFRSRSGPPHSLPGGHAGEHLTPVPPRSARQHPRCLAAPRHCGVLRHPGVAAVPTRAGAGSFAGALARVVALSRSGPCLRPRSSRGFPALLDGWQRDRVPRARRKKPSLQTGTTSQGGAYARSVGIQGYEKSLAVAMRTRIQSAPELVDAHARIARRSCSTSGLLRSRSSTCTSVRSPTGT